MYFSNPPSSLGIYVGDKVDVLFNIDINEWGGKECVQLIIRDIRPSKAQQKIFREERERFDAIRGGARFTEEEEILPKREDFAAVYKLMLSSQRSGVNVLSHRDITSKFTGANGEVKIGYAKLKIIIMVLKELNLVSLDEVSDEVYNFNIHYNSAKTELEKSTLLRKLRNQLLKN